jgi:hypothetical protein
MRTSSHISINSYYISFSPYSIPHTPRAPSHAHAHIRLAHLPLPLSFTLSLSLSLFLLSFSPHSPAIYIPPPSPSSSSSLYSPSSILLHCHCAPLLHPYIHLFIHHLHHHPNPSPSCAHTAHTHSRAHSFIRIDISSQPQLPSSSPYPLLHHRAIDAACIMHLHLYTSVHTLTSIPYISRLSTRSSIVRPSHVRAARDPRTCALHIDLRAFGRLIIMLKWSMLYD